MHFTKKEKDMSKRKLLLIVAAVFVIASFPLWAHGQQQSSGATASAAKINLGVTWWGSQTRDQRTIKVIKMYEKTHPNIHFTWQFSGWSDYWTKVTTQAAGKNLPDIMQQDYAYIDQWHHRGLLTDLNPYVKSGVLDFSNVKPLYLTGGKIDGHLYAVDLGANSQVFVLNKADFQKAGIPMPSKDWTWKQFEQIALKLHQKLGIWGVGPGLTNSQMWKSLYLGLGKWGYAKNGKSLGYTNSTPFVDYLTMALKLQSAGAMPSESDVLTYKNKSVEQNPIVNGKSAMATFWSNQIVAVKTAAGSKADLVLYPLPRPTGGHPENYIKDSQFFSVSTQSKHPKAAAAFINYFTNSVAANKVLLAERGVPISSKVRKALRPLVSPAGKEEFDFVSYVANGHGMPTPPPDPNQAANVINNVYQPLVIQPVMFGKISPAKGAQILMKDANAILSGKQQ